MLLVGGTREAIEGLRANRDLLLLEWSASRTAAAPLRPPRADHLRRCWSLYAASGIGPIVIGALAAALAMILAGCLNIRQAVRAFDRRIYLMIGAVARRRRGTGGDRRAPVLANAAVGRRCRRARLGDPVGDLPGGQRCSPTSRPTTPPPSCSRRSRSASPTSSVPTPLPFVVAVMLAASCAFATPVGYQTNMLVMGPGHYRFSDYLVGGVPLVILMWLSFRSSALGIMVSRATPRHHGRPRMTQHTTETPQFYLTAPAPCPYLPGRAERKVFTHLVGDRAAALNDILTQGGFRRSQNIAYRPACEGCRACVSVRVHRRRVRA